jgi:hypothetical protein
MILIYSYNYNCLYKTPNLNYRGSYRKRLNCAVNKDIFFSLDYVANATGANVAIPSYERVSHPDALPNSLSDYARLEAYTALVFYNIL